MSRPINKHQRSMSIAPSKKTIHVLHHADSDGRFAGYCAWLYYTQKGWLDSVAFYEVQYNRPFPLEIENLSKDDRVYILDFSFDRETMDRVHEKVTSLIVLDHHETAQRALEGAPYAHYDMSKSGALLAWEFFFPGEIAPRVCTLVNDYDLWHHNDADSEPLEAWLQFKRIGQKWHEWDDICKHEAILQDAIKDGRIVAEQNKSIVESFIRHPENIAFRDFHYGEDLKKVKLAVYNGNSILRNEIASAIYKRFKVDATVQFRIKNNEVTFSLRSRDKNKFSVLEIATSYGGGGHAGSAGMALPLSAGMKVVEHFLTKLQQS